jgi:hypothetical protein
VPALVATLQKSSEAVRCREYGLALGIEDTGEPVPAGEQP